MVYFLYPNSILLLMVFIFLMPSCTSDDGNVLGKTQLKNLQEEILEMANSKACNDNGLWRFSALGSKPCGGPNSYIAYSTEINTALFMTKLEKYNKGMAEYNSRNGLISDCAMVAMPTGLICKESKPVFIYSDSAGY